MEKAIYLIPGMKVKISLDMEVEPGERGSGAFINPKQTKRYNGKNFDLVNGFAVDDDTVGSIEPVSDEPAINYTHKKPQKNVIYFWSFEEWLETISIIGVPIHDHSSIIQGGPAFGTYFTDDEVI